MNEPQRDQQLDSRLKESLSWQADQAIEHQPPTRLAMRRLATRIGETEPDASLTDMRPRIARRTSVGRLAANIAGVALVAAGVAWAVAYLSGPGSDFGASGPVHTSERHGYTLRLPDASWGVTQVPGEWAIGTFLDAQAPGSDYFEKGPNAPRQNLVFAWLSSQTIPTDMTFDGWLYLQDGVTAASASCFELQGEYRYVLVGGETARVGVYHCPNFQESGVGWATVQVLLEHNGRGYALYFWPEQEPDMAPLDDVRREAMNWLSRFRFTEPAASP